MTPEQVEMVRSAERTARSAVFAAQARFVALCLLIVLAAVALWWYFASDIRAVTGRAYPAAIVVYIVLVRLIGQPLYRPMRRRTRNVVARRTGDLIRRYSVQSFPPGSYLEALLRIPDTCIQAPEAKSEPE